MAKAESKKILGSFMTTSTAHLVTRLEDGYGEVFQLQPGVRYTLGRAATCRIVLKDELCSREHAEVVDRDGVWLIRDLGSLNGTRLNGESVASEMVLEPLSDLRLGKSRFIFVQDLGDLPELSRKTGKTGETVAIRKRSNETRFLKKGESDTTGPAGSTPRSGQMDFELSSLYQMALRMGTARSRERLVEIVLDGLLEVIPAEVGAVLQVGESRDLDLVAYRHRNPSARTYHKVSNFVSSEVISSHQAVLAEDVAHDQSLANRESLAELKATSLICAPILFDGQILGLIHLYSVHADRRLDAEHLEFTVAAATALGASWHQLKVQQELTAENIALKDSLRIESELVGSSEAMKAIESQIGRVATTQATVLIRGESGVGKELVARAIHFSSPRRGAAFICLNCAALTETLLESELFGHERGAFTGATERMAGKFESADKGTIFLDEIGEMNIGTQAKLLRVLEGHPFERVGGNTPIKVNVRVVAATNQPLENNVRAGTFRKDLFYRLQVVEIVVPPLRERRTDIPMLAEHFLNRFVREMGRKIRGFTPAAIAKLQAHDWPGNVRELRNVIERSVALSAGATLDAPDIWLTHLNEAVTVVEAQPKQFRPLSLMELEKEQILETLNYTDWNKSRAAEILGIERSTLDRKIKAFDLHR